jgi:hypothetical protein
MGGGQSNKGQATTAANNANASSQQNLKIGATNQQDYQSLFNTFFGRPGSAGTPGGTLSPFLDPSSINVTQPTGAFKLNLQQANKATEQEGQNAFGNVVRQAANNGLNLSSPAVAYFQRKNAMDLADQKGSNFTNAVNQQHQEALNNFWGATSTAADLGKSADAASVGATSGSGSTAAGIYGTAGQYHQNPATSIIGSGVSAGGAVGAAAVCPALGSKIKTPNGSRKVEELRKGDLISQSNGRAIRLAADPVRYDGVELVLVELTDGRRGVVGERHAYAHPDGGFFYARDTKAGNRVITEDGVGIVYEWTRFGNGTVFGIETEAEHSNRTYCADGIWSLE